MQPVIPVQSSAQPSIQPPAKPTVPFYNKESSTAKVSPSPLTSNNRDPSAASPPASSNNVKSKWSRFDSLISPVSVTDSRQRRRNDSYEDFFDNSLWRYLYKQWYEGYLQVAILWLVWMAGGTAFYAIKADFGWAKGFFMMVNVGYSIGSVYFELDNEGLWFSTFNVLIGALALGVLDHRFVLN